MKSRIIYIIAGVLLTGVWSCEEYLDKVETSGLTVNDVFGTYTHFQGYQDQMYDKMVPYNNFYNNTSYNYGDHVVANATGMPTYQFDVGNYWAWYTYPRSVFSDIDVDQDQYEGIWTGGWRGIRIANQCLSKIDSLKEATDEQRDLLLGQAYFFRAYFHWEIIRAFGGIPYIDTVLNPADNMKFPRPSYHEANAKIVEDLDRATELLPADWEETETGQLVPLGNRGRATKGAALGLKAKALLYAASPLMNNESTGSGYVYNDALLEQAAAAAHELLKLADQGYYSLFPLENYSDIFYTLDGTVTFGQETIWQRVHEPNKNGFAGYKNQGPGRLFMGGRLGQVQNCEAPTQNLVDLFEMQASGLPIDDPESGYDPSDPWAGRDPRFEKSILTDGTKWVKSFADDNPQAYLQLYTQPTQGADRGPQGSLTGYLAKKFWPYGVNAVDQEWGSFWFRCPVIRLAEIYLIYAEAVNELYGPTTAPTFGGETGMTAEEAVNVIRTRAEMPDVNAKFTGDKIAFRERIRNERSVEFCFEGQRWNDLRRWHIGHLPEYKTLYGLDFDKDHKSFSKAWILDRVFEEKHYWLPFRVEEVLLYEDYKQNPGW